MGASTEEIKRVFQNKQLDHLTPKPFSGNASFKQHSVKAPIKTGDGNAPRQCLGPLLSSDDLLNRKLKPVSSPDSVLNESVKNEEDVPEFMRKKLKSPAEKIAEVSQKSSPQKIIENAIKKDSLSVKKPPVTAIKPSIPAKHNDLEQVQSDEDNGDNHEISSAVRLNRACSVKERSSFFEENDKLAKATSLPQKPPIKPKTAIQCLPRNEKTPDELSNSVKKYPEAEINNAVDEELYDDVASTNLNQNVHTKTGNDVSRNCPLSTKQQVMQEEFYDDVTHHLLEVHQQSHDVTEHNDEFYDDVDTARPSVNTASQQQANLQEDEVYDDVALVVEKKTIEQNIPVKMPKSFSQISSEKFIVPFGLEKWLQAVLITQKSRLKLFANTTFNPPLIQRDAKPSELVPTEDELGHVNNDVGIERGNELLTKIEKPDKERKKEEKERLERERKEKKEKEKREKEEKRKEKKEKERKEKEYRQFGLNPDQPLVVAGSVSCCSDFQKPKDKLDIPYSVGDEFNIIECKKCPPNKILVQNTTTGRLGYALRKDFGLEDEVLETDTTKNRSVSLIPTEDEDQDLYEDIPGQQQMLQAPPVPETPRPNLRPDITEEDLYNDVDDGGAVDQIYEEL